MDNYSGNKESVFNEAQLKMYRLDSLQRNINACMSNPYSKNPEGFWGYEVMFNSIQALIAEVYPKLSSAEKVKMRSDIKEIKTFMREKKMFETKTRDRWASTFLEPTKDLIELIDTLQELDWQVRDYLDIHKLGSPNAKDVTKSVIDM